MSLYVPKYDWCTIMYVCVCIVQVSLLHYPTMCACLGLVKQLLANKAAAFQDTYKASAKCHMPNRDNTCIMWAYWAIANAIPPLI